MVPFVMRHYKADRDDVKAYEDWLKTPLAEKIDAVVDANSYHYEFALVYNYEERHYRRVIDSCDVRPNEITIFFNKNDGRLETEADVLYLIDETMERVKDMLREKEAR